MTRKHKKNPEIVRLKLTSYNKNGLLNKINNIKLVGIDRRGGEHHLKFVSQEMAWLLLDNSRPGEVENDMVFNAKPNPHIQGDTNGKQTHGIR